MGMIEIIRHWSEGPPWHWSDGNLLIDFAWGTERGEGRTFFWNVSKVEGLVKRAIIILGKRAMKSTEKAESRKQKAESFCSLVFCFSGFILFGFFFLIYSFLLLF